ncbi:hypothetical protein RF11_12379 [Thelohanellus kitauei]|uniref:Uncharacterized protein n=1 Tax=Thelohanellus kitauei TaxID=669202 RepID=A0A0C2N990_THEKT|nr:hypothetical protein RF11_12379 [Thelohanellus kitauei]
MHKLNTFLHSSKDLVPYRTKYEYYNDFEKNPSVGPSRPSLLVASSYDLICDTETINQGDFWTYVIVCVRRPGKYRNLVTEKLLKDNEVKWSKIMNNYMIEKTIFNDMYWFAFNAFKLSGPELDAFIIYQALNSTHGLLERNSYYLDTLMEILCTRSYRQICEIKKMYLKYYNVNLTDSVCSKLKGSLKTFFFNILTKNKDQFIEIFSRINFVDIKDMITYFQEVRNVDITCRLKGILASKLRKCANAISEYCTNKELFFAKCCKEYIRNSNIKGAISIILTRSEIDLSDIIEEYRLRYKIWLIDDIQKLCETSYKPLCQL